MERQKEVINWSSPTQRRRLADAKYFIVTIFSRYLLLKLLNYIFFLYRNDLLS